MDRRQFHLHLLLAGLVPGMARAGTAPSPDGYPDRPIRIVVPYPAGGVVDVVLRAVCDPLSNALPQRIVIENRPGADGRIGLDAVAKAPADGYTLLGVAPILAVGEHLMPEMKARSKDFVGVCGVAAPPTVFVVHDTVPARTLKEFVALAAARPGEFNAANPGTGSSIHLAQELFFERTGIRLTNVSYKGQPPALLDLGSGLLQFALISQSLVLPLIQSGKVRALAVNAATRTRSLPEVPTIAQAGYPDLLVQSWYGIGAPAHLDAAVLNQLSAALKKTLQNPELVKTIEQQSAIVDYQTPQQFRQTVERSNQAWARLVKDIAFEKM